jgi:hypothetical protein
MCAAEEDKIPVRATSGAEIHKASPNEKPNCSPLALEALTFGVAYAAGLCWASVCLVGSFGDSELPARYWAGIPGLRTAIARTVAVLITDLNPGAAAGDLPQGASASAAPCARCPFARPHLRSLGQWAEPVAPGDEHPVPAAQ